jgi:hypothetical protein
MCSRCWHRCDAWLAAPGGSLRRGAQLRARHSPRRRHEPIQLHKLRGNVTILEDSGGNIAVLTGPDGKVFIDAGITVSRQHTLEAINGLSSDPIRHVINTHRHFEHTDGNQRLNEEGAAIIAQENTHKHLLQAVQRAPDWAFTFTASPLAAIPTETFSTEKSLKLSGSTLHLRRFGPAHTDRRPDRSLQGHRSAPGQATQECHFEVLSRLPARDAHHLLGHDQPGAPRIHQDVKSQTSNRRSAKATIPHAASQRLQHLKVRLARSETSNGVQ